MSFIKTYFFIFILLLNGCGNSIEKLKLSDENFYWRNHSELLNIAQIARHDTILLKISSDNFGLLKTYRYYHIELLNNHKAYEFFITIDDPKKNGKEFWRLPLNKIILDNGLNLDSALKNAKIDSASFMKWINIINKLDIYMIYNYTKNDTGNVVFAIEPGHDFIFSSDSIEIFRENTDYEILRKIDSNVIYHQYRTTGFLW